MTKPVKLTSWFPASVNPVHVGVYEVNTLNGTLFRNWTGAHWAVASSNRSWASEFTAASCAQECEWRGLAEKPG